MTVTEKVQQRFNQLTPNQKIEQEVQDRFFTDPINLTNKELQALIRLAKKELQRRYNAGRNA